MSVAEWLALIGIACAMGTAQFVANKRTIETLVGRRLDDLQKAIENLTEASKDHGEQLVRHQTILELNGLTEVRKHRL